MADEGTVVIVGASVGGVRTAQSLRAQGHDGRIVLIGGERELPYDRPPLSKQFLTGQWETEKLALLTEETAEADRIELRLGAVAKQLHPVEKTILLWDGRTIPYDTVVVATGADAKPSPWVTESGVHVLRTLRQSRRLRQDLERDEPVVVIGGGFIGSEVASSAQWLGREVTIVDPLLVPVARILGPEMAEAFADVHFDHGVRTHFGVGVRQLEGRSGALEVTLTDGRILRAGTAVVGVGATPNDDWLATSGLPTGDGAICDRYCRMGGRTDAYAVGDVARWFDEGLEDHFRVEHWTNAVEQAECVAYNITHGEDPRAYRSLPYVWSDQYDWKIQISGRPHLARRHLVVGEPLRTPPRFAALFSDDGFRLSGAVTVNWPKASMTCRRLLKLDSTLMTAHDQLAGLAVTTAPPAVR
jgi:phthalate 3,4-dioxygenase ferredoxin reductase subunit